MNCTLNVWLKVDADPQGLGAASCSSYFSSNRTTIFGSVMERDIVNSLNLNIRQIISSAGVDAKRIHLSYQRPDDTQYNPRMTVHLVVETVTKSKTKAFIFNYEAGLAGSSIETELLKFANNFDIKSLLEKISSAGIEVYDFVPAQDAIESDY